MRIHDLRHSYASMAATGGAPLLYIGKLLGHTQAQTTARYAHLANDPVKQVNEEVGRRIAAAMGGHVAEVSSLRRRNR
jgi:site-specific recombinase XerD